MKLIEQYVEFSGQTPTDMQECKKWIELAGRTCYKSESKIGNDSANKFVNRMLKSGHHSVLEHSNIVFQASCVRPDLIINSFGERMAFHQVEAINGITYVNGNIRAWIETCEKLKEKENVNIIHLIALFNALFLENTNNLIEDRGDFLLGTHRWGVVYDADKIPERLRKYTVRFITNRAMTHEIVRHRKDIAYSQESQRYVNYKNGIEFIIPVWATDLKNPSIIVGNKISLQESAVWLGTCETIEKVYISLINIGLKPQQARECLPNSTKTEIVVTGGFEAWKWFFNLRTSKAADPQMQDLAKKCLHHFNKNGIL